MLESIPFIVIAAVIIFEIVTKRKLKVQISEEPLTTGEKVWIWIFCIINPILAGAILYYGWKKRLPNKAKSANRISWYAVLILLLFALVPFLFIIVG